MSSSGDSCFFMLTVPGVGNQMGMLTFPFEDRLAYGNGKEKGVREGFCTVLGGHVYKLDKVLTASSCSLHLSSRQSVWARKEKREGE